MISNPKRLKTVFKKSISFFEQRIHTWIQVLKHCKRLDMARYMGVRIPLPQDGLNKVMIPKGTSGTVCEVYDDFALVEIWGEHAPEGVWGVYDFYFNEIKEIS